MNGDIVGCCKLRAELQELNFENTKYCKNKGIKNKECKADMKECSYYKLRRKCANGEIVGTCNLKFEDIKKVQDLATRNGRGNCNG